MIRVQNVRKKFVRYKNKREKEEFYADDGISFEAREGEILGILGPNGAGKTTLLRMIGGLMEPTEGSVFYDDKTFEKNEIEIKQSIAYLSGNTRLYESLSPWELLSMCAEIYSVPRRKAEERIREIADMLDMNEFLHSRIGALSTGQTQKVNIARCLVHNPRYYILDEATTGLDIISSQIILEFMKKERQQGKTILYSTHYMEEAENICDRVIMINKGVVISMGTPEEILLETKSGNLRDAFFVLTGGADHEE